MTIGKHVRRTLAALAAVALCGGALLSCGGTGACIGAVDIVGACFDGRTKDNCYGGPWTYRDGATCSSLGFTVQCPASMCKNCWCKP